MNQLEHLLRETPPTVQEGMIGLDGFVDEIIHIVKQRQDTTHYTRIENMEEFCDTIYSSIGLSSNFEFVPVQTKAGGNGPIFALGLKKLGMHISYLGCVGDGVIDAAFSELAQGSDMYPLAAPGHTQAIEFFEGKLICSTLDSLNNLTWEIVRERMGVAHLAQMIERSLLVSMNNWTMIPDMNRIWSGILHEVLPFLDNSELRNKTMFFDLADPNKRTKEDILTALELIGCFSDAGLHTVLGLNKREAQHIASLLNINYHDLSLQEIVERIYQRIHVCGLVVHPVECAAYCDQNGYAEVAGPYCAHPVLTTGAGDTFNSGFVYGLINGLSPKHCLELGVCASGFYVRAARNGAAIELADFYRKWKANAALE